MPITNRWASDMALSSGWRLACYTGAVSEMPASEADSSAAPGHGHGLAYALVAAFLLALAFGAWGLWATFGPRPNDARATIKAQAQRIAELEQSVATLSRSDQISRD